MVDTPTVYFPSHLIKHNNVFMSRERKRGERKYYSGTEVKKPLASKSGKRGGGEERQLLVERSQNVVVSEEMVPERRQ